jgi:arabinose-5-phosphate isomerase
MKEVMSPNFKCASSEMLAMDSMKLLKEFKITHLLITNESNNLLGALNIHDLLQAGIVRSI